MPTYRSPAFLFDDRAIETGLLEIGLSRSSFAYEPSGTWMGLLPGMILPDNVTPTAISFEAQTLMLYAQEGMWAYLGDIRWGAGRETRILLLEVGYGASGDGVEIMVPISGDTMPDLGRGDMRLFREMLWTADFDFDGTIRNGPLAAGRRIDADDLFADATSGRLRQGDNGADSLFGRRGDDLIVGQGGNDVLKGRGGADTILAGHGHDRLAGGRGDDVLSGWGGRDRLAGQGGDDLLIGGRGRDRLLGQNGHDELWAEDGNDRLAGGRGDDWLAGGSGADDFVFGRRHGDDTISDFDTSEDRLVLDDRLWRGTRDAEAVVDRFAETTETGTLLDFRHKGSVLLEDIWIDGPAKRAALIEAIEIA